MRLTREELYQQRKDIILQFLAKKPDSTNVDLVAHAFHDFRHTKPTPVTGTRWRVSQWWYQPKYRTIASVTKRMEAESLIIGRVNQWGMMSNVSWRVK